MTVITYYNLSQDESPCNLTDGTTHEISKLLFIAATSKQLISSFLGSDKNLSVRNLDPLGIKNPEKWENCMSLLIWAISGRKPLRQEVLRGRQILYMLPSWFKKSTDLHQFSFAFLPYILVGFKTHLEKRFIPDSNCLKDVVEFIVRLSKTPHQIFESFLCAHRQKDGDKKFHLVDDVHVLKASTALNLSKALLTNNPWGQIHEIQWFQQGATEFACLNMFPEMFLRYLIAGEIPNLLSRLDGHLQQIEGMMRVDTDSYLRTQICGADSRSLKVLQFISDRYGISWKSVDFSSQKFSMDPLVRIAIKDTLPLVFRFTPFYTNEALFRECLENKRVYINRNIANLKETASEHTTELIEAVIENFYEIQCMHQTAKALYETTFYYLWGEHSRINNSLSVGIDRDHAEFQYSAWNFGFSLNETESVASSLLYARRSAEGKDTNLLKDYSIRQFWR